MLCLSHFAGNVKGDMCIIQDCRQSRLSCPLLGLLEVGYCHLLESVIEQRLVKPATSGSVVVCSFWLSDCPAVINLFTFIHHIGLQQHFITCTGHHDRSGRLVMISHLMIPLASYNLSKWPNPLSWVIYKAGLVIIDYMRGRDTLQRLSSSE